MGKLSNALAPVTPVRFIGKARAFCACALFLVTSVQAQEHLARAAESTAGARAGVLDSTAAARTNPITDLVLIYDGAADRVPWTVDRFRPYVYREADGKVEWLYDGFLFLDRLAKSGRRLSPITNRKDATKSDWQALLDHYFQPGQSLGALDQLLESLAQQGHRPARKRSVVLALPTPLTGSDPTRIVITSEWGNLDGRELDFTRAADRLKAACWYVDEALRLWQQRHYQHLELAGFYWLFERAWKVHHTADIAKYIHSRHYSFYWIPSWPQGRTNWRQYGFDFVYQQPNYFFHRRPTPADRIEEACRFAESCGTSMEMEFNKDLLTKPQFLGYFDQYLQVYQRHQVWQKRPVAYYEGAGAWFEMARSQDPAVHQRYKALADIIVARQKKADAGIAFRQDAK